MNTSCRYSNPDRAYFDTDNYKCFFCNNMLKEYNYYPFKDLKCEKCNTIYVFREKLEETLNANKSYYSLELEECQIESKYNNKIYCFIQIFLYSKTMLYYSNRKNNFLTKIKEFDQLLDITPENANNKLKTILTFI